ncbi:MAG: xanthine dehydrogenase family protein subunit M [Pigmentiphaga sp.]|uniref:FAD binding domain-containing protein n=1 Tax=Pigmentiphaga sp. TaxID=1977564 RepID=UPI0029A1E0C4|nr:xanthine dehydrogenase family protein subunit M [Pigmentiphaga sp.]MDX3908028.1 xanthine dehydrogenase family protein subunit M [Pigmentiphaga sp.]
MKLPAFEYRRPASLEEAARILAEQEGGAKLVAGGQSLVPVMAFRLASPTVLVDLARVPGLRGIDIGDDGVRIGAMTRWRDIEDEARLRRACPLVAEAVGHIAHYQIRNRGTIGGNLSHADPASEMPGVVVACEAELEVFGPSGTRRVAAADFFTGPLSTCLAHDEILQAVRFPSWPAVRRWAFEEFALRRGDFAYAGIALYYDEDGGGCAHNTHVSVIGATDIPRRLPAVEAAINGQRVEGPAIAEAARLASASVTPPDDIHASADYRRALVGTLVERALAAAAARS